MPVRDDRAPVWAIWLLIAFGAARMLTRGIEEAGLKEYNSHLGAVFGLAKGVVVCLVMTFFLATLDATHNVIANSKSGYYAAITMQKIHPIMPEKLHDALNRYIHSLDNIPGVGPIEHDHVVDPNVGLADAIVDLVSTGNTLRANKLVAVEQIMSVSARLVVNQAALKLKDGVLKPLLEAFRQAVERASTDVPA